MVGIATNANGKLNANVDNMKCTGLNAVSCPAPMKFEKGSTVQFGTNTRINFMQCYLPFLSRNL
jgi:hypothetical protein